MDAVESYIDTLEEPNKSALKHVAAIVRDLAPKAEVKIYYGVPSFLVHGKLLVGIASGKKHMSLYPTGSGIDAMQNRLKDYSLSRGTIRFTADKPLSDQLLTELITVRLAQIG